MTTHANTEIARLLDEFADRLEAHGFDYNPTAYRRAAETIREYPGDIGELAAAGEEALTELDDVGDAIASKIIEYTETGTIDELEELRSELPVDIEGLTRVEGVGPKTVGTLYEELGITDLDELERAAAEGQIREVHGFGPTTEENIAENVQFAREARERERLGDARPLADDVVAHLSEHDAVDRVDVAGSIRRWRDTIGDVDVLVASEDGDSAVDAFLDWAGASRGSDDGNFIEAGSTKASVRAEGVRVDLRVVPPDEFGAALQYFTGSKDHNVHLRNLAIDRDLKINEYGVFDVSAVADPDAGQRVGERLGGAREAEIYGALDLPPIPPELREDTGEIEAARKAALPELVETEDIRGDLHTHTDWSDGSATPQEMITAAAARGYEYHCITDHATGPGVFGNVGLSAGEIRDQREEVMRLAADSEIEVFHGIETNITADGDISTDEALLADLDIVVASPHAALDQGDGTERLIRAVEHPAVDILGHPTGRLINERAGLDVDYRRLAEAAADADTALEINANPARLDLHGEAVRAATEVGATIAVNTDAHAPPSFANIRYGVHTARRGWAEQADVLNAREPAELRAFLSN